MAFLGVFSREGAQVNGLRPGGAQRIICPICLEPGFEKAPNQSRQSEFMEGLHLNTRNLDILY